MSRRKCNKVLTSSLTRFLQLKDTPDSYEGQDAKFLAVDETTGTIVFIDVAGLNLGFLNDNTLYNVTSTAVVGDFVHNISSDTVVLADKGDLNNLPILGVIVAKPTTTTCIIQTLGYLDGFTGLVPGETYYLGLAGKITITPTSTAGQALYPVGVAKSSTRLELRIDSDYIVRA
jgi:hypothetical protein